MATNARLNATSRSGRGKGAARKLRAGGRVPAVVYGHNEQTRHISVDHHELELLFSRISVENTIIDLAIEGDGRREVKALVREVQAHPVKKQIRHVDFYQIHANEPVAVEVPIRLLGTPAGVRSGGILQQMLHDLSIRCLPADIPEAVEADVSALEVGESLHVSELRLPDRVTVEVEGDRPVCSVQPPTVQVLEAEAGEAEAAGGEAEPELIRKRGEEESEGSD